MTLYPAYGSSPRVWGQVQDFYDVVNNYRIIPTRVGTSTIRVALAPDSLNHPHACGDKFPFVVVVLSEIGSSPRVWGQVCPYKNCLIPVRIIPTRVGTSHALPYNYACWGDHPHACGDKLYFGIISCILVGSSPRVWGQVEHCERVSIILRIIPTRVGTRKVALQAVDLSWDHPHACGDKKLSYRFHKKGVGSSPRVWGQVVFTSL